MPLNKDQQLEMYRRMQRIRQFEEAATRLYQEGKIPGACHCSIGQEAAIVGACMALNNNDNMTGTHRSHGHPIGKGGKLDVLMAELMGKETGNCMHNTGRAHIVEAPFLYKPAICMPAPGCCDNPGKRSKDDCKNEERYKTDTLDNCTRKN